MACFHLVFSMLSSIPMDNNPHLILFLMRLGFFPDPGSTWLCYQPVPFQGKHSPYHLQPGFSESSSLHAHFIVTGVFLSSRCCRHYFPQGWLIAVGALLFSTHAQAAFVQALHSSRRLELKPTPFSQTMVSLLPEIHWGIDLLYSLQFKFIRGLNS